MKNPLHYREEPFEETEVILVTDKPDRYNRIVPEEMFNREVLELYSFGPEEGREAVLLFNEKTKLSEEKTIEYFI